MALLNGIFRLGHIEVPKYNSTHLDLNRLSKESNHDYQCVHYSILSSSSSSDANQDMSLSTVRAIEGFNIFFTAIFEKIIIS